MVKRSRANLVRFLYLSMELQYNEYSVRLSRIQILIMVQILYRSLKRG
jgi:hypothetical protein